MVSFTDVDVDLDRVEIHRAGELVPVEPQVFDVLAYLIEHRDRVVRKEELLDNIWGDRFVSESALTSRIKSARQAVGDNGRDQWAIKTIHGRGYRFVAEVEQPAPTARPDGNADAVAGTPARVPDGVEDTVGADGSDGAMLDDRWPLVGRHDALDQLHEYFETAAYAGVLLTGPAGVGKTRLATECAARAEMAGVRTLRIHGHSETADIPLGSISHLLPADVLDVAGSEPDLARAIVFQRARSAIGELGAGDRLVVLVDNVDHLDELTSALLGSLLTSGAVFAIMTQRTDDGDPLAFGELVRSHQLAHLEVTPLDDTDLDVLLYRVLSGPIDLRSLESLTQLARGRVGALERLVAACRASGALDRRAGVWRLVGPVDAANVPDDGPSSLDQLSTEAREAAELLAVAGDLDIDLAADLLSSTSLDELDRLGWLALADSSNGTRVSLARAELASHLVNRLGPLRARRHKAALVELLGRQTDLTAIDVLRLTRWSIETGSPPTRDDIVAALRYAVSIADALDGEVLVNHLERSAPGADVTYLRAELAFRLGQTDTADDLLAAIDHDDMDVTDAARATRRRATIAFHVRGRYAEAIDALTQAHGRLDERVESEQAGRVLLMTHAIGLLGFLGYADEIDAAAARLPDDITGPAALELARGRAQAAFVRGRCQEALDLMAWHRAESASLDPDVAQAGDEVAMSIELNSLAVMGRLTDAMELLRAHVPVGKRTMLAWLPLAASRVLLAAGNPRDARSMIMTPLAAVRSQNLLHAEPLMTGLLAQATVRLGDLDATHAQLELIERQRPQLVGHMRWTLTRSVADTLLVLGDHERAREVATADVDDAMSHGAVATAADFLILAALAGGAADVVDSIREVVGGFDGPLWPVRMRHVEALADGSSDRLDEIAAEFRQLGYAGLAAHATPAGR